MSRTAALVLALLPGFAVGFAFGLGKIVRDCSLTCNVGYRYAPLAVFAVAISTLPIAALRARFESRLGHVRWQIGTILVVAVSFFAFRGATALALGSGAARWIYLGFFVWLGVVGAVLGPNVKSTIYRLCPPHARARMLGWSAAAVMAGGLIGSVAAARFVPWLMQQLALPYESARDWLMVAMGLALTLWLPAAFRRPDRDSLVPPSDAPRPGLPTALRWVIDDPRHRRLAALMTITGVAEAIVVYLFYWIVSEQTSPSGGRTVFFAEFYTWLHAGTLAFLILGANRVVDRLGLFVAFVSLPLALFAGAVVFLVHTVLVVMYVMRIAEAVIEDSVYGLGVERALLGVEEAKAPVVRPLLQGLMGRVGRGIGAVLVMGLAVGLELDMTAVIVFYLAVLVGWVAVAFASKAIVTSPRSDAALTAPVPARGETEG